MFASMHARRFSSLRLASTFAAITLALTAATQAPAATFTIADGNVQALIDAINDANANDEADTIMLAANGTYTLDDFDNETDGPNGLPSVTSVVTIEGNGATIERDDADDTPYFRIFHVAEFGDLTLTDMTVRNGRAQSDAANTDYDGGGAYVLGALELSGAVVRDCYADRHGGGISNNGGALLIGNASGIRNNEAEGYGGGVHNFGGTAAVTGGTEVSGNHAVEYGGGVYNESGTVEITGGAVNQNTVEEYYGAGIYSYTGIARVRETLVDGNKTDGTYGGGIHSEGSALEVIGSTVSNNFATSYGGGIYSDSTNLELLNTVVTENETENYAAGVYNYDGSAKVSDCTISSNVSASYGGGIYNDSATMTMTNSTISANRTGDYGGGIYNGNSTLELINSTVSGNRATDDGDGGGIYNDRGTLLATNCTITSNSAAGEGGGIYNYDSSSVVILTNTIVANQAQGLDCDGDQPVTSRGYNIDSDGTCNLDAAGDKPNTDPKLASLADNGGPTQTHALLEGSPAIDAGTNDAGPAFDQRGESRPKGNAKDIGAFEFVPAGGPGGGGPGGGGTNSPCGSGVGGLAMIMPLGLLGIGRLGQRRQAQ